MNQFLYKYISKNTNVISITKKITKQIRSREVTTELVYPLREGKEFNLFNLNDTHHQSAFVEWAGKKLRIKDASDWYNVTPKVSSPHSNFVLFQRT